jgi:hypothetical protein
MKKSCNNCKALDGFGCSIGYKTELVNHYPDRYDQGLKPLEMCEKPITNKELINIKRS